MRPVSVGLNFRVEGRKWLRGLDLNQRPLGYERPEISVSIGQQGTSGNPEIPLGTAGNRVLGTIWGPIFGSPNDVPNDPPNDLLMVESRRLWSSCGVAMQPLPSATNADPQVVLAGFSDLPPKPPRSKLEPHRDLIRELRRKGQTYRDVARLFQERLGLYVAPSTLHSFVKVRAKHRKRSQFELPSLELAEVANSPALQRVAALKAKPAIPNAKPTRFVFRENEPLTLTSDGGEQ